MDVALVEGRNTIISTINNNADEGGWLDPVLFMRSPDGHIFE